VPLCANISTIVNDIFENDRTYLDIFFAKLSSAYDVELFKRESLIVFDEVQLFPIARQMIKYLVADGMIVNPCFNATDPNVGLALSFEHSTHKLYMADTGLLITHTFREKSNTHNEFYRLGRCIYYVHKGCYDKR